MKAASLAVVVVMAVVVAVVVVVVVVTQIKARGQTRAMIISSTCAQLRFSLYGGGGTPGLGCCNY
jgi:hypothetical protein